MRTSLLFLLISWGVLRANAQTESITGLVKSSDNKPAQHVNVRLKGTNKGAVTNNEGEYEIKEVNPGTYILTVSFVGLEAKEAEVTVKEGETLQVPDIILMETKAQLREVVISGQKQKREYVEPLSAIATRVNMSLLETPQSVQIITGQTLHDQQVFTVVEAIKNMAGVSQYNGGQYNDFSMRGFRTREGNFAYNGQRGSMNDSYSPQNLFNVERIEAIKGPASIYFGAANPGGVINIVTKKPKEDEAYSLDYTLGSWNTHRFTADATGPLTKNKKLLYRAIVGYQNNESFRDFISAKTLFLAPSITYRPTEKTSVNFEYSLLRRNEKGGGYYERGIVAPDPDNLFLLPISWTSHEPTDKSHEYNHSFQLNATHQFNDHFSITTLNRYLTNDAQQEYHHLNWGSLTNADGVNDTISRHYREYPWTTNSFFSNTFTSFKVNTGKIKHTLVGGIDYGIYKVNFLNTEGGFNSRYTGIAPLNVFNPVYGQSNPGNYTGFEIWAGPTTDSRFLGAYVQDFIEFSPKVKAMLGLRYDTYSNKHESEYAYFENKGEYVFDPANMYRYTSTSDALVPRIGLIYLPKEYISLYGSYIQSFLPQYSDLPNEGGPFPPEKGEQFEVGVKGAFFNKKFIPTLALYQIYNRNILTPDPNNPDRQTVNGLAGSRGVEVTMQGEIVKGLNVIANYAYNETKMLEDANGEEAIHWFANAPNTIANLWSIYEFSNGKLRGLKFGGGFYHVGKRYTFEDGTLVFPAYTTWDAMIGYSFKNYSASVNFNNIADKKYISGGWYYDMIMPGAPFNFRANVAVKF